jgi:erythromycin esterase-like protein
MVGMYMKQRYGRENFMLAHLFAEIPAQCGRPSIAPPPGTVEALFSAVEKPSFLLDLRSAPRDVTDWLKVDRDEFGAPPLNTISVGNAYDALFFTRSVSPVLPCP